VHDRQCAEEPRRDGGGHLELAADARIGEDERLLLSPRQPEHVRRLAFGQRAVFLVHRRQHLFADPQLAILADESTVRARDIRARDRSAMPLTRARSHPFNTPWRSMVDPTT
jgi:hypothetical protein